MPKIPEIVTYINNTLKAGQFKAGVFQSGRFSGITEPQKYNEDGETVPTVVNLNGDCTYLGVDDSYPFELYHKIINVDTPTDEADDYGDRLVRTDSYNLQIVVIANREIVQLDRTTLVSGVTLGMPRELPKSTKTTLGLLTAQVQPGTVTLDKQTVYSTEYNLQEFLLKPSYVMFAVDYTITTQVYADCYTICE